MDSKTEEDKKEENLPIIMVSKTPKSDISGNSNIPNKKKLPISQPVKKVEVPVGKLIKPMLENVENLLIKSDIETDDHFNIRYVYSKIAFNLFQGQINPATAVLLGQLAADKAIYGVTYSEESDKFMRYLDDQINRSIKSEENKESIKSKEIQVK